MDWCKEIIISCLWNLFLGKFKWMTSYHEKQLLSDTLTWPFYTISLSLSLYLNHFAPLSSCIFSLSLSATISLFFSVSLSFCLSCSISSSHFIPLSVCVSVCLCVSLLFFLPVNVSDLIYVFTCLIIYFLSISLYHLFSSLPIWHEF